MRGGRYNKEEEKQILKARRELYSTWRILTLDSAHEMLTLWEKWRPKVDLHGYYDEQETVVLECIQLLEDKIVVLEGGDPTSSLQEFEVEREEAAVRLARRQEEKSPPPVRLEPEPQGDQYSGTVKLPAASSPVAETPSPPAAAADDGADAADDGGDAAADDGGDAAADDGGDAAGSLQNNLQRLGNPSFVFPTSVDGPTFYSGQIINVNGGKKGEDTIHVVSYKLNTKLSTKVSSSCILRYRSLNDPNMDIKRAIVGHTGIWRKNNDFSRWSPVNHDELMSAALAGEVLAYRNEFLPESINGLYNTQEGSPVQTFKDLVDYSYEISHTRATSHSHPLYNAYR